jgi:hypothetical protein
MWRERMGSIIMTSKYNCGTCKNVECECHEKNDHKDGFVFGIVSINRFTAEKGCASHSDFNKPKKSHDVEEFYKEERIPKYKDTIFEETEDGGAIIGYLTESPSGCARPNIAKLTKKQYVDYKKNNVNYGD